MLRHRTTTTVFSGLFALALAFGPTACEQSSDKVKTPAAQGATDKKNQEQVKDKAAADQAAKPGGGLPFDQDAAIIDADFKIAVNVLGLEVCDGTIKVKVNAAIGSKNSAQLFQIPKGIIDCTVYQFDLAQILGSVTNKAPKIDVKDPLVIQDGIISMKAMGSGLYQPARPLFPSFLAAEREVLRNLDKRVELRLDDKKENKSANGSAHFKVSSLGQPYKPETMERTFSDTLQFEINIEGFEGINKVENFIFERMAFVLSLNPVAILHLEFEGPASDLAGGAAAAGIDIPKDDAGFVDGLINVVGGLIDVGITMDLIKMANVDTSAKAQNQDQGPVIGGQKSN